MFFYQEIKKKNEIYIYIKKQQQKKKVRELRKNDET